MAGENSGGAGGVMGSDLAGAGAGGVEPEAGGAGGAGGEAGAPHATGGGGGVDTGPRCGNGVVQGIETCDDGNTTPGDGCNAACALEPHWSCVGTPSTCVWLGGPSCGSLAASCGPAGDTNCCDARLVSGGTFKRSNDASYPATVSDFRLDAFEVTVGRFRQFVTAYPQSMPATGSGKNPNNAADVGWSMSFNTSLADSQQALIQAVTCAQAYVAYTANNDSLPMSCVSWFEAQAFCIWDGGRLPSEAEWNFAAASGPKQLPYPWSTSATDVSITSANLVFDGLARPGAVGSKSPTGDSLLGISDLSGNVDEWLADYAGSYPLPCVDCSNATVASARMFRGGSFASDAHDQITTFRGVGLDPAQRQSHIGFRCARSP
jgi:cysteine-rich repeat protein